MTPYQSNLSLSAAAGLLLECQSPLITTHAKPDGDAFGSVIALTQALRLLGKKPRAVFMPPLSDNLARLRGSEIAQVVLSPAELASVKPDLAVVLDTGAWTQLSPLRSVLEPLCDRMLIVDHHLGGDVPAKAKIVDAAAAATCEILGDLLDELQKLSPAVSLFDATVCESLFVGIASDTGWFRFSNTRPHTHRWAARLLQAGVDHAEIFRRVDQCERKERLSLMTRALTSLRMLAGGKAAIMVLTAEDFAQTGARLEETERFVDLPQSVSSVQVVALITQPPAGAGRDGKISVSLRSKPGEGAINVADLAGTFGGGGHARAAGAKLSAPLDSVVQQVISAIELAVR